MRILIVEDEAEAAEELAEFLAGELEATVDAVSTLEQARAALGETAYDGVIADYKLPDGFGHTLFLPDACRPGAVRVIWSGDIRDAAGSLSGKDGIVFLQKPVNLDELLAAFPARRPVP